MQIVIDIPESKFKDPSSIDLFYMVGAIKNGIPLPKGHGKIVDIGKIDEDRIEADNPIIYITVNGEYTEAVSLDYLNNLPTVVDADKESEVKE